MFARVRSVAGRVFSRGLSFSDLVLGAVGNPRLAVKAAGHVLRKKSRVLESSVRMAENRPRGPAVTRPVGRDAVLAGLAERMGLLLIEQVPTRTHVGLAEVELLHALIWLAKSALGFQMAVDGKRVTFGTTGIKSLVLAAPFVTVTYQTESERGGLETETLVLEPYFRQATRKWVSQNTGNDVARAIYDDRFDTPGLTRVDDLFGAPTYAQAGNSRAVDVVYTWVNHADPDWAAMYARFKAQAAGEEVGGEGAPAPKSADATALSRFHSNDELRYSLRSVAQNLPWVRQIYVFTNCAPPDWLRTSHPGVRWVRHEDVIPSDYLPTFSSHVIESFLHRIPGISDQFIYINDDVFVAQPLRPRFFFEPNGLSRSLLESYAMVSGPMVEGDPDYLNASRNSAALIREVFGHVPTQLHRHTTFALRRDVLDEIEARWPDQLHALRKNRFRTGHDLNLVSFLYHHYALATCRAVEATATTAFVKSLDVRWKRQLKRAEEISPEIICINEGGDGAPSADWHVSVREFLEKSWPDAAPWEK